MLFLPLYAKLTSRGREEAIGEYNHPSGAYGIDCCEGWRSPCEEALGSAEIRNCEKGWQGWWQGQSGVIDARAASRDRPKGSRGAVEEEGLASYRTAPHTEAIPRFRCGVSCLKWSTVDANRRYPRPVCFLC